VPLTYPATSRAPYKEKEKKMHEEQVTTNVPATREDSELITFTIPDEEIAAILSLAPEAFYASIRENGIFFKSLDRTVPFLTGRIIKAYTYLGRFDGGTLQKMPLCMEPYPDGYQARIELTVLDPEKTTILSLPPSSTKNAQAYVQSLVNRGLKLEGVITRIGIVQRTSPQGGLYGVATFTELPEADLGREPTIVQAVVENVSSAQPPGLNNPWSK
jgi:hypothetical protein